MSDETRARTSNVWFHLTALACAAFTFTVLLMVAAAFRGRPAALTRFFNDQGMLLLGVEVGVILALTIVAMAVDRRQTLRRLREREASLLSAARSAAAPPGTLDSAASSDARPPEEAGTQ
jgi:hypothetical protein